MGKPKHLPEELMEEILSNSAVKSLLRFKCASKRWRFLISSKRFTKLHLHKSNTDPGLSHHTLISRTTRPGHGFTCCSLKHFLLHDQEDYNYNHNDDPITISSWDHHPMLTSDSIYGPDPDELKVVGSCNGLILIMDGSGDVLLWNPSTRKLKNIPPTSCPQGISHGRLSEHFVYGLGYDDSTDDYKVVRIIAPEQHLEIHQTKIFSVGTDTWKEIESFGLSYKIGESVSGTFVNGKLHWLGLKVFGRLDIVSLSLVEGEEKYQVVASPDYGSGFNDVVVNLGGYLSYIIVNHKMDMDIEVWVMTEYGVTESWTMIWTRWSSCEPRRIYYDFTTPFWVTDKGDIFMETFRGKVLVLNGENKLGEYRISIPPTIYFECFQPSVYVESLVSP